MIGWYNSQHLFFQCPAGKKNMGFFFLSDHILVGIIDVRHFVGFLFRRYGKKTIQQAIYFPKICVRILKGYVQSLSLDISSAEQFLHQFDAGWPITELDSEPLVTWQAQCPSRILVGFLRFLLCISVCVGYLCTVHGDNLAANVECKGLQNTILEKDHKHNNLITRMQVRKFK